MKRDEYVTWMQTIELQIRYMSSDFKQRLILALKDRLVKAGVTGNLCDMGVVISLIELLSVCNPNKKKED